MGGWVLVACAIFAVFPVVRVLPRGTAGENRLLWSISEGSFLIQLEALSAWFIAVVGEVVGNRRFRQTTQGGHAMSCDHKKKLTLAAIGFKTESYPVIYSNGM